LEKVKILLMFTTTLCLLGSLPCMKRKRTQVVIIIIIIVIMFTYIFVQQISKLKNQPNIHIPSYCIKQTCPRDFDLVDSTTYTFLLFCRGFLHYLPKPIVAENTIILVVNTFSENCSTFLYAHAEQTHIEQHSCLAESYSC